MRSRRRLLSLRLDGMIDPVLDRYINGREKFEEIIASISNNWRDSWNGGKSKTNNPGGIYGQLEAGLKTNNKTVTVKYVTRYQWISEEDNRLYTQTVYLDETFVKK